MFDPVGQYASYSPALIPCVGLRPNFRCSGFLQFAARRAGYVMSAGHRVFA